MPDLYMYTTTDGKTISLNNILYIDAIYSEEKDTIFYKVVYQNNDSITILHHDAKALKKDRRKLELAWEKYLRYKRK